MRRTRRALGAVAPPLPAFARNGAGDPVVGVHAGAEKFAARKVRFQALDGARAAVTDGIATGDRVGTGGAAGSGPVR